MAWVVVEFTEDQTVGIAVEKWLTKVGKYKKCFYPKTNITSKVKAAVDVDKKSNKWQLYSCRLLMNEKRYATYELARKAEKIAQNHSTMASFEESYSLKQKSRKRPNVYFDSSSASETENQDFQNIKKLSQLDAGLTVDIHKKYNYLSSNHINRLSKNDKKRPGKNAANCVLSNDQFLSNDDGRSSDNEKNRSSENDGNQHFETFDDDDGQSSDNEDNRSSENDESFKAKFGLVEPIKSEKDINKLIYDTSRKMKDAMRKAKKGKKAKAENTKTDEQDEVDREANAAKNEKARKAAKKAAKLKRAKEAADEAERYVTSQQVERASNVDYEKPNDENENDEERKKAKKAAKKAAKLEKRKQAIEEVKRYEKCKQRKALIGDEAEENTDAKKAKKTEKSRN